MDSFVIDIDGTLCPIKKIDESYEDLIPYSEMVNKLKVLKENGFRIILFTSRNMRSFNGNLDLILKNTKPILEQWLKKWNIPYDEVIYGKPWPGKRGFYVDDRAVRPNEFLTNSIEELEVLCDKDKRISEVV